MVAIEEITRNFQNLAIKHSVKSVSDGVGHSFARARNFFFVNKKTKALSILILAYDKRVSLRQLASAIGASSSHLRMADESAVEKALCSKREQFSLFSLPFGDCKADLLIDEEILDDARPLAVLSPSTDSEILIASTDLMKFLGSFDCLPRPIKLEAEAPPTEDKKAKTIKEEKEVLISAKNEQIKTEKGKNDRDEKGLSCSKKENFSKWYSEVVTKAEMIEYYEISGCYILRPNSLFIWNKIKEYFNREIEKLGVQEAYFPMFVSKTALEAEAAHIDGFKLEVAWVTKSGDNDLHVPIAIRPTSETIMYPTYRNWIRSHRDLPLKLNQWSNVVRWEFKNPMPFIRSREFLWQEGHTAFSSREEADEEVLAVLDIYAAVYEQLLAVPVIKGRKTETEKFPGGDYTTTVEAFIVGSGRSVQAATSHSLGQNFGKIFSIEYEDEHKSKRIPFQNSWGLTTRSIGVMIMTHGDDRGLVLPPLVARIQIVIVPIFTKNGREDSQFRGQYMRLQSTLSERNLRVHVDERENYKPGWKYNFWELQGVPLRIEFGPKDAALNQCVMARRDTTEKMTVALDESAAKAEQTLAAIQSNLLRLARERAQKRKTRVKNWAEFETALLKGCFAEAPFCNREQCEESIKARTKQAEEESKKRAEDEQAAFGGKFRSSLSGSAKSLCTPLEQEALSEGAVCFACDEAAQNFTLFGRSY